MSKRYFERCVLTIHRSQFASYKEIDGLLNYLRNTRTGWDLGWELVRETSSKPIKIISFRTTRDDCSHPRILIKDIQKSLGKKQALLTVHYRENHSFGFGKEKANDPVPKG